MPTTVPVAVPLAPPTAAPAAAPAAVPGEVSTAARSRVPAQAVPERIPENVEESLRKHAVPLTCEDIRATACSGGLGACLDALLEQIGDRRWVLLGEATHGTHEFYGLRAALTRRLIEDRGFRVVAVEGEWQACFRVNRFLRTGRAGGDFGGTFPSEDSSLAQALQGFSEFPKWMWRNKETVDLLEWIASFNRSTGEAVRWYGLDLQGSLRAPAESVVRYAEMLDATFAEELRRELRPFLEHESPSELGRRLAMRERDGRLRVMAQHPVQDLPTPGEGDIDPVHLQQTLERLLAAMQVRNRDDFAFMCPVEEALSAEQCLDVLLSGQEYYRKQYTDSEVTWNLRDQHMAATVVRLAEHLEVHSTAQPGAQPPGIVIWAHDSHIGDARASDRGKTAGQWNLGHMIRETFGAYNTFLLGFTTHDGEVLAATEWGGPARTLQLRPPFGNSWESALHSRTLELQQETDSSTQAATAGLLWPCGETKCACNDTTLWHRLVGVVYKPESELRSHGSAVELSDMYDAVVHVDTTTPVAPMY